MRSGHFVGRDLHTFAEMAIQVVIIWLVVLFRSWGCFITALASVSSISYRCIYARPSIIQTVLLMSVFQQRLSFQLFYFMTITKL